MTIALGGEWLNPVDEQEGQTSLQCSCKMLVMALHFQVDLAFMG